MALTPKHILRNCTIFADRENRIGQAAEITIPSIEATKEEFLNAGMVKTREVTMNVVNALVLEIKETALDPQMLHLFGKPDTEYMVVGALRNADGGEKEDAVLYYRGDMTKMDLGSWQAGEKAETSFEVSAHYLKFEIGGKPIIELDDFNLSINGVEIFGYSDSMING